MGYPTPNDASTNRLHRPKLQGTSGIGAEKTVRVRRLRILYEIVYIYNIYYIYNYIERNNIHKILNNTIT